MHVPLAGRSVRGVVVEAGGPSQHEGELARVERLADEPRIAPVVLELCLWIAAYYGSTPARALALALPPRVRRAARHLGLRHRRAGRDGASGGRCSSCWPTARCR